MVVDVKNEDHPLEGLWLHQKGYVLSNSLFSKELQKITLQQTGLKLSDVDDFWAPIKGGKNPEFTWVELVDLSIKILSSDMTKLLCHTMALYHEVTFESKSIEPIELPIHQVQVAKRLNFTANWVNYFNNKSELLTKFRMYGENTSEKVEGNWLQWISFATQVLASENTNRCCPQVYCKEIGFLC